MFNFPWGCWNEKEPTNNKSFQWGTRQVYDRELPFSRRGFTEREEDVNANQRGIRRARGKNLDILDKLIWTMTKFKCSCERMSKPVGHARLIGEKETNKVTLRCGLCFETRYWNRVGLSESTYNIVIVEKLVLQATRTLLYRSRSTRKTTKHHLARRTINPSQVML